LEFSDWPHGTAFTPITAKAWDQYQGTPSGVPKNIINIPRLRAAALDCLSDVQPEVDRRKLSP
jgi:hypothetical protein